jgi:trk system potassium uptake protein TrkH
LPLTQDALPSGGPGIPTVLFAIGCLLIVLAGSMLLPTAADLIQRHEDWQGFGIASGVTLFVGVALVLSFRRPARVVDLRTGFMLTTFTWVGVALFASLPFQFGSLELSPADAFFETVSGLTTTGSTVLTGLDTMPAGLLLWRSVLQWLGGLGIVVLALIFLPFLRVGGMQLFRTESSDRSEKLLPSTTAILTRLTVIYVGLTLACIMALRVAGFSLFNAVCHAFTALSTGGYSTKDSSIGGFENPAAEWVLIVFMAAGALPFMRYLAIVQGRPELFWRDSQIRLFAALCLGAAILLALWLVATEGRWPEDAFRAALFNVVSIVTTTGFASEDYTLWGMPAVGLFLALTVVGGCTGSTAGGIKMFRFEILWMSALLYVQSLILPNRVARVRYNGRPVDVEIINAVLSFVFFFMGMWGLFTVALAALGLDLVTAISGAATALANVGPGLGTIIGPAGNFQSLSDPVKWVLSLAMLMGRLEFFTILVLFHPAFWRR